MTYPLAFRKKILKIKETEGLSFAEIAKRFGVSKAVIFRWSKQIEQQETKT